MCAIAFYARRHRFNNPRSRAIHTKLNPTLSFSEVWKTDFIAGLQVFLIALPLCLGISIASGVPPLAGVLSAIIGGLIVSRFNGSHVTIIGPAAGLIAVILGSIESLGQGDTAAGYRFTLAAIVFAGLIQMALGQLKAGKLCNVFPLSAVHGMLAAIGLIIFSKQFPVMLGTKPEATTVLKTFLEIPAIISRANADVALIGLVGLALMIGLNMVKNKWLKLIPPPMVVVISGLILSKFLDFEHEHTVSFAHQSFSVGPRYLIQWPDQLFSSLGHPNFGIIATGRFWVAVFSIAIIASLESLLSAVAIDKLDPLKRKSDMNKDIFALGIGTTLAGLLGGLPMIAEIVRSSANVSAGAKTGWANFFHGVALLAAVFLVPGIIRMVPLASLAAILVYTGFRLASPKEFIKTTKIGLDQLSIFLVTIITVLATDLLVGIAAGCLVKFLLHLFRGVAFKEFVRVRYEIQDNKEGVQVKIIGPAVFTNLMPLSDLFGSLNRTRMTFIDLSEARFIDHTAMELIHRLEAEFAAAGGQLETMLNENHVGYADHPLAARRFKLS